MSTITAFDMGRFYRIVGIDNTRIRGDLIVMGGDDKDDVWIEFRDMLVWMDEGHHWGQTFFRDDFKGKVTNGIVDLHDRDFSDRARPVFMEHKDLFSAILVAAAKAAAYQDGDFKSQIVVEPEANALVLGGERD